MHISIIYISAAFCTKVSLCASFSKFCLLAVASNIIVLQSDTIWTSYISTSRLNSLQYNSYDRIFVILGNLVAQDHIIQSSKIFFATAFEENGIPFPLILESRIIRLSSRQKKCLKKSRHALLR